MTMPTRTPIPSLFAGKAWQQVLARDTAADGQFFYAVKSTKIYCKPSCPSRRPTRKNVTFFPTTAAAQAAGYRACLRCNPDSAAPKDDPQAAAIATVASYIDQHSGERIKLRDLAKETGISPFVLLRGFKRVLGVTPREYAASKRAARFTEEVRKPRARITDAIYEAGYGSSSRVPSTSTIGLTPTEIRRGGAGLTIRYALADSPLGRVMVASTEKGICNVAFGDSNEALLTELTEHYPKATLERDDKSLATSVNAVVAHLGEHPASLKLPLDVRATAFQERVWKALRAIPRGQTRSYAEVATALGSPNSVRAVARAIATNPVALVNPCHRVIGSDGSLTGYRWGTERKRKLLALEQQK